VTATTRGGQREQSGDADGDPQRRRSWPADAPSSWLAAQLGQPAATSFPCR
jgi:hypothetical protein